MTEDYYATLGVEPRSEAAAIRAAYLALMRRYHPDKNDSPAAIERAHAIIAAFKVLGDAEKRLHYDWGRRRAAEAAAQPPRSRLGRLTPASIAAAMVVLVLVSILVMPSPPTVRDPPVAPTASGADVAQVPMSAPERGAITPIAASAPIAVSKPEPVIEEVPIAPPAEPRLRVEAKPPLPALAQRVPLPRERPPARQAAKAKMPPAKASAKCRLVKPGAEAAICNDDNLTALDRSVVTFYNQSLIFGAATKRAALLDSRDAFLARREECRSAACLRDLHLSHLREMSAILEDRLPDPAQ